MKNKIMNIYRKYEEIQNLKEQRELLNMKLALCILNKNDEIELKNIQSEIQRLTIIIGDKYIDSYTKLKLDIKIAISTILTEEVQEKKIYNHALKLEQYIINQFNIVNKKEYEEEIPLLINSYKKLGYYPKSTCKDLSTIKQDSIEENKIDYVKEVIYIIMEKENIPNDEILKLIILKEEITKKSKEKAIKKINKKKI